MKLLSVRTVLTPDITQIGLFEAKSGQQYSVYFRSADLKMAPDRTDHFFIVGLIAAFLRGEPYRHLGAVDQQLFENVHTAMDQWSDWWGHRPVSVFAETIDFHADQAMAARTASLLSGGVDSMFTAQTSGGDIDAFVNLAHTRQLGDQSFGSNGHDNLLSYANCVGKELFTVETNIMYAFPEIEDAWSSLTHGPCLAAIGHFLGRELAELYISSSFATNQLRPWGSHPLTDHLMSSSDLKFLHMGDEYNRLQKHRAVARDPIALRHLSVCERGPQRGEFINCSKCQKCLRSMITLDLLGIERDAAPSFDWSDYDPARLRQFLLQGHVNSSELLDYAQQIGRDDIAQILGDVITYSKRYRWIVQLELFFRRRFRGVSKYKMVLMRLRAAVYALMNIKSRRQ